MDTVPDKTRDDLRRTQTKHFQQEPSAKAAKSVSTSQHIEALNNYGDQQVTVAQFETSQLSISAPEDTTYVAYCLNERKKIFNKQLTQLGIRLNQDISRRKQLLQAAYERDTTKILAQDRKNLAPDVDKLRTDKLAVTAKVKEEKLKQLEASIDRDQQAEIARAQAQFEAEKRQAIERSQQKLAIETQEISEELATKSTQELNTSIKKLEQQAQDNLMARKASLNRQTLGAMQAAITDWLAEGNKIIEDWVAAKSRELSEYEREVTREHREALEASASQQRAAMNWEKVHDNEAEIVTLQQRLQEFENKNLALQSTNQRSQNEVADLKQKLAKQAVEVGTASAQMAQSKEPSNSNKLFDLYLAKQLGQGEDTSTAAQSSKWKRWLSVVAIALLSIGLLGGGVGGYVYISRLNTHQTYQQEKAKQTIADQAKNLKQQTAENKKVSKQVADLQSKADDQSATLKQSQSKQKKLENQLQAAKAESATSATTSRVESTGTSNNNN